MQFFKRPHEKIEDTIRNAFVSVDDPMNELTNKNTPSDNPFYKYVLEELEGGITHKQFQEKIERTTNPLDYLENRGIKYDEVSEWMALNGFDKQATRCLEIHKKLKSGEPPRAVLEPEIVAKRWKKASWNRENKFFYETMRLLSF